MAIPFHNAVDSLRPRFGMLWLLVLLQLALQAGATSLARRQPKAPCEFAESEPLNSCAKVKRGEQLWQQHLEEAWSHLCKDSQTAPYMDVFLDKRFRQNYEKAYNSDGWTDAAWVNYVALKKAGDTYGQLTERLVESVHRFSKHPIVVVNFGLQDPGLDPARFPRLVLLHARALDRGVSFNFNKFRAILLAQVKVGASLDSDMMMATPHADQLLQRTEEEINEKYRFPMMPTHFLDRDPRDSESGKGNFAKYTCDQCPTPTMRWGQAQPTWTHWSLNFVSRWLAAKIAGRPEQGVPTRDISEDEDLLNVALWKEGATKSWCAFQTGGINFLWENLYPQHPPGPSPYYDDPRYFPEGVPVAFYFGHAEKDPKHIDKALQYLAEPSRASMSSPKPFFHNMTFYASFKDLAKANPNLKCTL
ncbi:unnamed protein product [Effrenium voratum]|uniref:Uncharacterized protein n=1 Tax=Effrenium voratum TaxID=2562239 RepID=A0AA36HQR8_9DINO|nr:unnamed protein product [Effrenium voratum]